MRSQRIDFFIGYFKGFYKQLLSSLSFYKCKKPRKIINQPFSVGLRRNIVFGIEIALEISDALSLFPRSVKTRGERKIKAMKVLQKILFTCTMVVCLSVAASAQNDGQQKPPKDPPVVNPGTKPPPQPTPQPPKKPSYAFVVADNELKRYLV